MSESRLNILRTLVSQREISLFTLNAPRGCMSGVSPLGMCAWLNEPEAVRVLLDCSAGRMLVDGMDLLGATPLMYAARDGNVAVVRCLLDRGARPDFRDVNHRTAVQYSLRHSDALWLCETYLRQARCQNHEVGHFRDRQLSTIPTKLIPLLELSLPIFTRRETLKNTNELIHAIRSSDLTLLDSLLPSSPLSSTTNSEASCSPVLLNLPDSNGWCPIHYCAATERPSIAVLDRCYNAGAEVSLFTTSEHYTPLHCLARRTHFSSHSLYIFALHLICDLYAPLGAKDRHEETCIHIAAEHGECIHVLMAFLDCDRNGVVRNMRNSRGLTALEVAKPRFRGAFDMQRCLDRPQSSMSTRTIRPTPLVSPAPLRPSEGSSREHTIFPPPQTDFDVTSASQCLLNNLRFVSSELSRHMKSMHPDTIHQVLQEASQASHDIISYFRAQVDDARKELDDARRTFYRVDAFWRAVSQAVEARLTDMLGRDEGLLFELALARRATRDSGDSQATAVSANNANPVVVGSPPKLGLLEEYVSVAEYKDVSIATDPPVLNVVIPQAVVTGVREFPWPEWLVLNPDTTSPKEQSGGAKLTVPQPERRPTTPRLDVFRNMLIGQRKDIGLKDSDEGRKTPKLPSDVTAKNGGGGGSSRFKTWLKKIVPDPPSPSLEIVIDTVGGCAVGRDVKVAGEAEREYSYHQREKQSEARKYDAAGTMAPALRAHVIALLTASRDLGSIEECITAADHFITTAYRSISRAEHIIQRALESRQKAVENIRLRHAQNPTRPPDLFTSFPGPASSDLSDYGPYCESSSALSSTSSSPQSSCVSLVSTLTDADDEDMRVLRELLERKIEARLEGSFDEIDQVVMWLRILKEVTRGVKNRTGL